VKTTENVLQAMADLGNGAERVEKEAAQKPAESVEQTAEQPAGDVVSYTSTPIAPKNDEKPHPDPVLAKTIATMSLAGFKGEQICSALRISPNTLHKHYQYEFDHGRTNLMTQVVESLAQRAVNGSDTAAIFLAKARLGWSDRQSVELTGKDGGPIEIAARQEILTTVNTLLAKGITIDGESEPLD